MIFIISELEQMDHFENVLNSNHLQIMQNTSALNFNLYIWKQATPQQTSLPLHNSIKIPLHL